jgi:PEP-CTERM motif-containing protein
MRTLLAAWAAGLLSMALPAAATPFSFSTGNPDGLMAMATRPSTGGKIEIEAADDFMLAGTTSITSARFTGLLSSQASLADIGAVGVEIYRVFPLDSDTGGTSGPPVFSTPQVPTRVNSPSDVAFAERDSGALDLTFTVSTLDTSFTANNSVVNGIHPLPGERTGGDGPVTGLEVEFTVTFTSPFVLPGGHYFFVPQVGLSDPFSDFLWLSAPKPIVAPGTPFSPDLQAWIRNEDLAPDWLRVGTDIVGGSPAPTFNATFSLAGESSSTSVPEPATLALIGVALIGLVGARQWSGRRNLHRRLRLARRRIARRDDRAR